MMQELQTARLRLRAPVFGDAPRIAALLNNFAIAGNLVTAPYPYLQSDAEAFLTGIFEKEGRPGLGDYAIELADHGVIGMLSLIDGPRGIGLGYYLGQPYWGRGLMSEAVGAAIKACFEISRDETISSGYFAFNKASAAVQRKFGFVETGRSMTHCLARNEQVRHIDTQLTRTAWNGTRR